MKTIPFSIIIGKAKYSGNYISPEDGTIAYLSYDVFEDKKYNKPITMSRGDGMINDSILSMCACYSFLYSTMLKEK